MVTIPPAVRGLLGLRPGDFLIMRVHNGMLIARRASPEMILDRTVVDAADLPPVKVGA